MNTRVVRIVGYVIVAAFAALGVDGGPADSAPAATERVSVDSSEAQTDCPFSFCSGRAALSADARFVSFSSLASDLVAGDTNGYRDVFVRDLSLGLTTRVSISSTGGEANGESDSPAISADGRFVAFHCGCTNLVPSGPGVLLHDRQTGETTDVSVDTQGNDIPITCCASMSDDARFVLFHLGGGPSGYIFVRDRFTETTEALDVAPVQSRASISSDGRYIAFDTRAALLPEDLDQSFDVFVFDRQTASFDLVSVTDSGGQAFGDNSWADVSSDGRYVAFQSNAPNLVAGDTNNAMDTFVHDRQLGLNTRVSVDSFGQQGNDLSFSPELTADGRFVTFNSSARLVPEDPDGIWDVYIHDRLTHVTTMASVNGSGQPGNNYSRDGRIDPTGRFVAFSSEASNLVPNDTNTTDDVFLRTLSNADDEGEADAFDTDDDNDGVSDVAEMTCGSDPLDVTPPLSRPERIDGPFADVDDDGDTQVDEALPAGALNFDCDGDGYKGSAENHTYSYLPGPPTDGDQKTCQEYDTSHPNPSHKPSKRWPADLSGHETGSFSHNKIDVVDLASFTNPVRYFGRNVGSNPMDVRWDLIPGSTVGTHINIVDLAALTAGPAAFPPMLGGAKAFGGPVCPYAP